MRFGVLPLVFPTPVRECRPLERQNKVGDLASPRKWRRKENRMAQKNQNESTTHLDIGPVLEAERWLFAKAKIAIRPASVFELQTSQFTLHPSLRDFQQFGQHP